MEPHSIITIGVVKGFLKRGVKMKVSKPEKKLAALRKIVTEKQYGKVEGSMVDLYSASAIVLVYDSLNDENKAKYLGLPVVRMATIAFKMMK